MKKYPVLTLLDGRKVIVDAEMEIKEGDHYWTGLNIIKRKHEYLNPNDAKIIFTIGFSLPNVEEIEIISEAEKLGFLAQDSAGGLINSINCWERAEHIDGFKSGYKAANKNFTEEDLRKAFEYFQYKPFPHNTGYLTFDEFKKSLTRPDISEVFIEYESGYTGKKDLLGRSEVVINNIKSFTAKDSSGKKINIRIKK